MKLAAKNPNTRGRTTNDRRSLIQSVVLASLPGAKSTSTIKPSIKKHAEALGLLESTFFRVRKSVIHKREALEHPELSVGTIYSQVVKSKGWTKINPELHKLIDQFIRNHPHVVTSLNKNDTVLVPGPDDPKKRIKKTKLLL